MQIKLYRACNLSLLIEYDDNLTTKVEQSDKSVLECVSYIQIDLTELAKISNAIVSSVAKAEDKVPDNTSLYK
jgi:hypothetical protein